MQAVDLLLELDGVLASDERLRELRLARVGARDELPDQCLTLEQAHDLAQRGLEILMVLDFAACVTACLSGVSRARSAFMACCFRRSRSGSGTYESGCSARHATNSLSFASIVSTNWCSTSLPVSPMNCA